MPRILRTVRCFIVLFLLVSFAQPGQADNPTPEGFVFDETDEVAAAAIDAKKKADPRSVFFEELNRATKAIGGMIASRDDMLAKKPAEFDLARYGLLEVLSMPSDTPALGPVNTSAFRALRSAAINHLNHVGTIIQYYPVAFDGLLKKRNLWLSGESRLESGGGGLAGDMRTISNGREELVKFAAANSYVLTLKSIRLSYAELLRDDIVSLKSYRLISDGRGGVNPRTMNVLAYIGAFLKNAEEDARYFKESFMPAVKEMGFTSQALLEVKEQLRDADGDLRRAADMVFGALEKLNTVVMANTTEEDQKRIQDFIEKDLAIGLTQVSRHRPSDLQRTSATIHIILGRTYTIPCF